MFICHELHVDDFVLEERRDRASFEAAGALVDAILRVAEGRGQRVAVRLRHPFAEAAAEHAQNPVAAWQERGHEIGVHAHSRRVRRTTLAVRALGIRPRAVVPGLIQSGRARAARILRSCLGLGFDVVTDRLEFNAHPYGGLHPWRPRPDLAGAGDGPFVFVEPSVDPFDWGILRRGAAGVEHAYGLGAEEMERLHGLLLRHLERPAPDRVSCFLVPFHEHNHAEAEGSLRPSERSLAAWDELLGRLASLPVGNRTPVEVADAWSPPRPAPEPAPRLEWLGELKSWALDRLPAAPGPRPRPRRTSPAPIRLGDPRPKGILVVSHAGVRGGTVEGLAPFGAPELPGWGVWLFDREAPFEPGNPRHAEQLAAVFTRARAEGVPTGILSYSAGVIPALLSGVDADFLVDAEGPADALSLRPPLAEPARAPLPSTEAWPARDGSRRPSLSSPGPEPFRLLKRLACPYHRLQAEIDHRWGACTLHARVMLGAAAGPAWLNGRPWTGEMTPLPGTLRRNGPAVAAILRNLLVSLT